MRSEAEARRSVFQPPLGLDEWSWPLADIGAALAELAEQAGFRVQPTVDIRVSPISLEQADEDSVNHWLGMVASQCGVEAEPVRVPYSDVERLLRSAAPALLRLPDSGRGGGTRVVALLRSGRWRLRVIGPDRRVYRVAPAVLRDAWCAAFEARQGPVITQLLRDADVPRRRQDQARRAILAAQFGGFPIRGCWIVRLSPNAGLLKQAQEARLSGPALLFLASQVVALLLTLASWWLIGQATLTGAFTSVALWGWAILVLASFAFQSLATLAQGELTIGISRLFKQRMLFGSLQLQPEEIRHQGIGQFLGRILEIETISQIAATGGLGVVLSVLQLVAALGLLSLGAGGQLLALAFGGWSGITGLLLWRALQQTASWTQTYRTMTHDLVERMVGHRTRLAQEDPAHWHDDEDALLSQYLRQSAQVDRLQVLIQAVVPRGWMVLGLFALIPVMLGTPPSPDGLAISLGGIMLANQALMQLVAGVQSLVQAVVAWRQLQPILQAATRPIETMTAEGVRLATGSLPVAAHLPMLRARQLGFRYGERGREVLQGCHLDIRSGERVLLQGVSGGGKSTLAALLSGVRQPSSGLLLLQGYDRYALGGAAWRRQVVSVPQFHENHVFTGTLAFNVLMGRRWPPEFQDLLEAEVVCRQLGLGDLIARMPAGMQQMVGESGWRLSHGERSRIFIARALLQGAEVIILDESFAALDPATLQRALSYVFEQAPTLLVIAHP